MKPNIFLALIAVIASVLLSFLIFKISEGCQYQWLYCIGSGIIFMLNLIPLIGIKLSNTRVNVNFRTLSTLFFVINLVLQVIFAVCEVKDWVYIIISGLVLIIYITVIYKMAHLNDENI